MIEQHETNCSSVGMTGALHIARQCGVLRSLERLKQEFDTNVTKFQVSTPIHGMPLSKLLLSGV